MCEKWKKTMTNCDLVRSHEPSSILPGQCLDERPHGRIQISYTPVWASTETMPQHGANRQLQEVLSFRSVKPWVIKCFYRAYGTFYKTRVVTTVCPSWNREIIFCLLKFSHPQLLYSVTVQLNSFCIPLQSFYFIIIQLNHKSLQLTIKYK